MAGVLVGSLLVWFATRATLPREIRLGTAVEGGLYYEEGQRIAEALERATGTPVAVIQTSGSQENGDLVRAGKIDAAIVQAGSTPLKELAIVTPLHYDVVHIVVRRELTRGMDGARVVDAASDLAGLDILVGLPASGMHRSAHAVLEHYGVLDDVRLHEAHFTELLGDEEKQYDAAIVTTGVENADIRRVLQSGQFDLLPLDSEAVARRFRYFDVYDIPARLYPPIPQRSIPTVATAALVVVREDATGELVTPLLDAIFADDLPDHFATMFLPGQAREMVSGRLHPATHRYYDPFGHYGVLHAILEGLVAGKELAFALGAAIYLLWDRWRRIRERDNQRLIQVQKNRLDAFLERTLEIERLQMDVVDPEQLQKYLDDVTNIKLQALDKLTHEDLRGDRTFAIFLMQCANLISKIQLKIMHRSRG